MGKLTGKATEKNMLDEIFLKLLGGIKVDIVMKDGMKIIGSVSAKHFGNDYETHHDKYKTKRYGDITVRIDDGKEIEIDCLDIDSLTVIPFVHTN